jgi:hypothetical protein
VDVPILVGQLHHFALSVFSPVLKWCFGDTESVLQPRLDTILQNALLTFG